MAKRFTDTEKWRDEWWGSLTNDYRMIWLYLVDSCSIAGIWKKDFRGLNFNCNTNITEAEFENVFSDRLIDCDGFFFIPKFLRFQYPKGLNSNKPAIISVVRELQLNNLIKTVNELFGNDYLIIKDKDKDKEKDKDKDNNKDKDKDNEEEVFGEKTGTSISIKKVYANDRIKRIYDLTKFFSQKEQQDFIRAGFTDYEGFMKENPSNVFKDEMHLYNAFRKFHVNKQLLSVSKNGARKKLTLKDIDG